LPIASARSGAGARAKRILLPVRHLQQWIEHNVLLLMKQAPFNKRDPQLVSAAGSCDDCPKHTGHNKLLFADVSRNTDACKLCGIWANASLSRWLSSIESKEIRVTSRLEPSAVPE
jgi:hypothetical protein